MLSLSLEMSVLDLGGTQALLINTSSPSAITDHNAQAITDQNGDSITD